MENILFKDLGLSEKTLKLLEKKGYTNPTEIQAKAIPELLKGEKDIIGQSQTGTGKTASFALPIIEKLKGGEGIKAIVLTPTRELAQQVAKDFNSFTDDFKLLTVYGGSSILDQIRTLKKGVDIVVGTPGRVLDLLNRRNLDLSNIDFFVLDEADEMLNMGFIDDIKLILKQAPAKKQMLLFSATMPPQIHSIAKKFMKEHIIVRVKKKDESHALIQQICYTVSNNNRFTALCRVIDFYKDFYGIVFCKTRAAVNDLNAKLSKYKYKSGTIHGDISQAQREKVLANFKNRKINILIATDVAARGIHVDDLTHVVNYSLPQNNESYVHRIGRTGRAGQKGIAATFVDHRERYKLRVLERLTKSTITIEDLPSIEEVQENINKAVKEKIESIINKHIDSEETPNDFASNIINKFSPKDIATALIKYTFGETLSRTKRMGKMLEVSSEGRRGRDNVFYVKHSRGSSNYRRNNHEKKGGYGKGDFHDKKGYCDKNHRFKKRNQERNYDKKVIT